MATTYGEKDGTRCYEYALTYVDDIIAILINTAGILGDTTNFAKLKNDKIEPPSDYLGAVSAEKNINGTKLRTMSTEKYL